MFLKAFQQRNVAFDNYGAVMPTSFAMAFVELYVIGSVVKTGWQLGIVSAVGLGGGLGCIAAMYLHHHIFRKGKQA